MSRSRRKWQSPPNVRWLDFFRFDASARYEFDRLEALNRITLDKRMRRGNPANPGRLCMKGRRAGRTQMFSNWSTSFFMVQAEVL